MMMNQCEKDTGKKLTQGIAKTIYINNLEFASWSLCMIVCMHGQI